METESKCDTLSYSKIIYRFESIRLAHDRIYVNMSELAEAIHDFYFLPGEVFTFDNSITASLKISKFPGVNIPNKEDEDEDDCAYLSILYSDYLQCKNNHEASLLAHFLTEKLSDYKRQSIVGMNVASIILNPKLIQTMERIDTFFKSAEEYKKYGIKHTRGVLLYGPPGTGKTSFVCEVVKKYPDAIVFDSLSGGLIYDEPYINKIKFTGRQGIRFIVYLNEMEGILQEDNDARRARVLKQIETLPNNTLLIATTNRPESIDVAFFNRPGRFEEAIYLGYPDWPEIEKFMQSRGCPDLALKEFTSGLNFAHLNELIYRVKINKEDPKVAYTEIKKLDSVKQLNTEKDPEKKSRVGFNDLY